MLSPTTLLFCLSFLVADSFEIPFAPPDGFSFTFQPSLPTYDFALPEWISGDGFEAWLRKEERVAIERLVANLAPVGSNARDAAPGAVIASPSRGEPGQPDYYYQCMRVRSPGKVHRDSRKT